MLKSVPLTPQGVYLSHHPSCILKVAAGHGTATGMAQPEQPTLFTARSHHPQGSQAVCWHRGEPRWVLALSCPVPTPSAWAQDCPQRPLRLVSRAAAVACRGRSVRRRPPFLLRLGVVGRVSWRQHLQESKLSVPSTPARRVSSAPTGRADGGLCWRGRGHPRVASGALPGAGLGAQQVAAECSRHRCLRGLRENPPLLSRL